MCEDRQSLAEYSRQVEIGVYHGRGCGGDAGDWRSQATKYHPGKASPRNVKRFRERDIVTMILANILWIVYVSINYLGMFMCMGLLWQLIRKESHAESNVLTVGLLIGCSIMSCTCATQCLLNMISARYDLTNTIACEIEAYLHCCAIVMQFLSVLAIGYRGYHYITHNGAKLPVSPIWIVIANCGIAIVISLIIGGISSANIVPSGAYCFYRFASPVIVYWFVPVMILALIAITIWQVLIFARLSGERRKNFFRISAIYILTFFLGWFSAPVASWYALAHDDQITPTLDIMVGILGSLHSMVVPIIYHRRVASPTVPQTHAIAITIPRNIRTSQTTPTNMPEASVTGAVNTQWSYAVHFE